MKLIEHLSFLWRKKRLLLPGFLLFSLHTVFAQSGTKIPITGTIVDSAGVGIPTVTVTEKGTKNSTATSTTGGFSMNIAGPRSVLVVTSVGYAPQEVRVGTQTSLIIRLQQTSEALGEVVVVGYGTQKKGSLTGSIATVTSKDLDRVHGGSTVSTGLAGKLAGVTFRMPEGRPGASANIQIRNMGTPLYVIDGIQQDEGQFNNLAPNDIESISVLKDASAAIYGVRAANGVVVVTTKKGATGRNTINIDAYSGWQNWYRFPNVVNNSYDYMRYRAEAEVNTNGSTNITQSELDKYKAGTDPAYRSFDWRKYVLRKNAPQNSVNININGGSDKVTYYVSATNLFQNSMLGREYKFNRSNIQSNVTAKLSNRLKVGVDMNGRVESRENPGVPGGDDYFLARFAVLRNTPLERPYANDNPNYLNNIGHTETNYAFLNEKISGKFRSDWRVLQTILHADYEIPGIKGLTLRGAYSYYIADELENNQEYTYNAYTYNPDTKNYDITGGSTNPWRDREQIKQINTNAQLQLNYSNTFGEHTIGATVVSERIKNHRTRNWLHASPISNNLPLIYFPTMDQYQDEDNTESRIGYIGRVTYNYANRYFLEASARRDASYLFAPGFQVGYFPGVSAGWRITEEPFMKQLVGNKNILSDLKLRGSYGVLGDDRNPSNATLPIVTPYAYLEGYNYNQGTAILDGNAVTVSRDKGVPTTRISWSKSKITDIGMDFTMLKGKLSGSFDYFYRKRTGLLGNKNDVLVPVEIGYSLPQENINSDAQYGEEMSLAYNGKVGQVNFNVGGNVSYTRAKSLNSYNPLFFNSWDQYRNSTENRYSHIDWGFITDGQFTSQEQINNYPVNIDGKGNRTLIPGDLIYRDVNGDGKIDNYDERPIGFGYGTQPNINFGFTIGLMYKDFDFNADFSGGAGYTWFQNWETRWAFQNNGNLNTIFEDRWHRADLFDVNSAWIPGKYPANRVNPGHGHSDYGGPDGNHWNSTFWLHNVKYVRARTIQLGYKLPSVILNKVKIQKARVYLNAYNMFSFDNLKQYGVDPEVSDDNGLQFPQNKVVNVGINITF
ncbi:SusC/RagA family TonB-linked outer membrane protein [Segetibacter koreensis]|uniref:SusC/RagA family TonB-linked outer membrane protein n=1 Tax=Segetibacter koreensis TaxID=398037 RepID=UPI000366C3A2|nr:TonB-dependent receptor [Segetibacter koreensis]